MIEQVCMQFTPATFKLTKEMSNAIDSFGRIEYRTRSSAIRELVRAGLRANGLAA
jgi:metal-responsive CopG/Arc/MetJ family transcriptional regulator